MKRISEMSICKEQLLTDTCMEHIVGVMTYRQ